MTEVFLDVQDIEQICFELARTKLGYDEPLPPFDTRYIGRLEAALDAPRRAIDGEFLYPTFERRAAVLFYELCKQHPFVNGNKRMALVTLLVYLVVNKQWIQVTSDRLYEIAKEVAASAPKQREATLQTLADFIKTNLQPLSELQEAA